MGRIGKLLKTEIEKFILATIETRYGFNQVAPLYAPSGDDSPPLEKDRIVLVKIDGTGKFAAVGVLGVSQGAKPGERILYSRDSDGKVQAVVKLLGDGKIEAVSPADIVLTAAGDFKVDAENSEVVSGKKTIIKGQDVELNGKVKATGGSFECTGIAAPEGRGCLCAQAFCIFTGAPHTGTKATGT